MRIQTTILRSKVARRMFLLFVVCAIVPIVLLTVLSSRVMTGHLDKQAWLRLRQTTKSAGMTLLGRLDRVESDLRSLALIVDLGAASQGNQQWNRVIEHLTPRVEGAAVVSKSGLTPLFGKAIPASSWSGLNVSAAHPGDCRLTQLRDDAGNPRIFLGLALDAAAHDGSLLVAELDPHYLWNMDDEIDGPWGAGLWVFDHEERPMFASLEWLEIPEEAMANLRSGASLQGLRWSWDGRGYRVVAWPVFLAPSFGHPSWTIVTAEPTESVLQSLVWTSEILPLVILLCMLVVVLASLVQIRKSLIPIISLREGTQQIAASDFTARVRVDSDDEFAQLALSFNTMAERLGAQFDTLQTQASIDRELLSTLDEDTIVDTLLTRAPERFRCACAAVTLVDRDRPDTVSTRFRLGDASAEHGAVLSATERSQILGGDTLITLPGSELHPHLSEVLGSDLEECLIVPIRSSTVSGSLTLGFLDKGTPTEGIRLEAQRIATQAGVALSNSLLLAQLDNANWETLYAMARAVDANSPWTAGHSERVTSLALELARLLEVSDEDMLTLHKGGLLHDVGKIGVPNQILDKPGRLTDEEFALMRDHVRIGANILEPISAYTREIPLVLYHHEWFDGKGYPEGLAGEEIPYLARILSVADVFDALASERPYRAGWDLPRVVDFLRDAAGTQFDPRVVSAFLELIETSSWKPQVAGLESPSLREVPTDAAAGSRVLVAAPLIRPGDRPVGSDGM